MKKLNKLSAFSLGIAVFAMFFGAGNIVFPLILGRETASMVPFSLIGFIATAVIVPIIGYISTILMEGNYDNFFNTIGRIPSIILVALCMIIIGPLGASRCVILSYASIQNYLPFSLFTYTLIAAVIVFILTARENKVVPILGKYLGPIKITLLVLILLLVFIFFKKAPQSELSPSEGIFLGLKNGYFTLDLIGGIFFSHLIYNAMTDKSQGKMPIKKLFIKGIKAGLIGGLFLALIYSGYGIATAIHGAELTSVPPEQLFSALSTKVLGFKGGILANMTVAVATLTTAIALTTLVADYLCFDIFKKKIPYVYVLLIVILINIMMENLQFSGIQKIIEPIAILIYPSFIILAIANILNKLTGFKYIKTSVLITFIITFIFQYIV